MKDELAERLLIKVMNWDENIIVKERPILQSLSSLKYDGYQQFSPGLRFIESLALWLNQFEEIHERELIYNKLVRERLIFISSDEITHFISLVYPDIIQPFVIKKAASVMGKDPNWITHITQQDEFKILLRKTLFLGLSDGAQVGTFRRLNSNLSNEQVWLTYDLSSDKKVDLMKDLLGDIAKIGVSEKLPEKDTFSTIVLLDDFSGSGKSFIRKKDETYKGKVFKVLNRLLSSEPEKGESEKSEPKKSLVEKNCDVIIVLYLATKQAKEHIEKCTKEYLDTVPYKGYNIEVTVQIVQQLNDSIKVGNAEDKELVNILKKYFDNSIVDLHWKEGDIKTPYLGFDAGALPLVVFHNTPNNSLPVLWSTTKKRIALFPRVTRHKEQ